MPITRLFKTLLLARCVVRGSGYTHASPKCMLSRITSTTRRVQPATFRCDHIFCRGAGRRILLCREGGLPWLEVQYRRLLAFSVSHTYHKQ